MTFSNLYRIKIYREHLVSVGSLTHKP